MAYWDGTHWATDPDAATVRGSSSAHARQGRASWFDWLMTGVMALALPVAALIASDQVSADPGGGLVGDVSVASDGTALAGPAEAVQWAGYEWRGRAPIQVGVRSYLTTPGLASAAVAAAASWSQSSVLDVVVGGGKRGIEIYEGDYGPDQHAAWTQVTKRNGYASSVTIFINIYKLGTASPSMQQFALCHEIGHALGLDHQWGATVPSCLSPEMSGTTPNATDFWQLELIYQD